MSSHQLIGSPISYYTGKVRAYLHFKNIPFEEVLSSTEVYKDIIVPRVGIPIIPLLITSDDVTLQDSTDIIDYLETQYPEQSVYPATPLQKLVALLFEIYGDEWLVIPAMHYRWSLPENREYAIRKFGETAAPEASPAEQLAIGMDRSGRFAGMLPNLGLTENSIAAVEKSYMQFLADFSAHLEHHPFLLGSRPSIGDYGLIGPLYAHLYLDPASGKIMEQHAPRVADWVKRMHDPEIHTGEFLPNDEIPSSLLPLLARMFSEHVPVLMSTLQQVAKWVEENPGDRKIPRRIGFHQFTVEGVTESRGIMPANQWMWQRAVDFYQSLDEKTKNQVKELFAPIISSGKTDVISALETPINPRIVREDYRFLIAG